MTITEQLLPFDPECPWCHGHSDPGVRFDGEDYRCVNCGRHVQAVCFVDKNDIRSFSVVKVERGLTDERSHRQRNRSRVQRRGWR